jgi:hypothetical protein
MAVKKVFAISRKCARACHTVGARSCPTLDRPAGSSGLNDASRVSRRGAGSSVQSDATMVGGPRSDPPLCCFHLAAAGNDMPLILNQNRCRSASRSPGAIAGFGRSVARMEPHFRGEGFSPPNRAKGTTMPPATG